MSDKTNATEKKTAKPTTVDDYVATKVLPEHQPIVAMLREFMREHAPLAKEVIKWNEPVWQGKKPIAVLSASKNHIAFVFSRGVEVTDKYGLLEGQGNVSRYVKITSFDHINLEALRDYVRQAVELDATQ